ncbi:MAG: cbb3-type cytochrome c oxidase N-terminal domain-containing protein [Flavobacteriaceae bacterium]
MKLKGYFRTAIFAVIVFAILWYLLDLTMVDLVEKPLVVLGFAILLIAILFNGKIVNNLRDTRTNSLTEEQKSSQFDWYKNLMKALTKSKPMEEEDDILMDHAYDGIRELDNDLPPWWLYGFYASIIYAIGYLSYYHLMDGDDQIVEFNKEMAQAKIDVEEYKKTAKNLIDATTVELITDEADLAAGKAIFAEKCVACHLADAGGSIGPNLTDKYWILGGGIKNVFTTVSEGGRDGKGMIPWKSELKPNEIAQVASYVISLQGTSPVKPKAPQGDLWETEEAVEE